MERRFSVGSTSDELVEPDPGGGATKTGIPHAIAAALTGDAAEGGATASTRDAAEGGAEEDDVINRRRGADGVIAAFGGGADGVVAALEGGADGVVAAFGGGADQKEEAPDDEAASEPFRPPPDAGTAPQPERRVDESASPEEAPVPAGASEALRPPIPNLSTKRRNGLVKAAA